ncbi:hypothetical protein ACFFS2_36190 [Streptomyces aurantiacus]|uniref:Uncharacterized protein n=1 Tax=Streptomyces aurantiacus TaxID=47760 RepID=A0A7G1P4S7_9ACTN|nr:hypothetical protein [Streptomyces aurantiacus]BCL30239.1 hypothetical protein GCM10017557_50980 [Streptomyces aurantiacus]
MQYPAHQGSGGGQLSDGCYLVLTDPCGGVYGAAASIGRIIEELSKGLREAEDNSVSGSFGEFINEAAKAMPDEVYSTEKVAAQGNRMILRILGLMMPIWKNG